MENLIAEFQSALDDHTREYRRRSELWRNRQLDVMDLCCDEQNKRIMTTRHALEDAVFDQFKVRLTGGNDNVLRAARELA